MTPTSFKFHLSIPRDASLVPVIRDLAAHAAVYTQLDAAAGAQFAARVAAASERALTAEPGACAVDFSCANGELLVTIGGETVRQPLPA
jgi:hypothetical protein